MDGRTHGRPSVAAAERSAYEALLESGSTRLPPDVERAFRLAYLRGERRRTRFGLVLGLVLFAGYAVWDALTFPAAISAWTVPLRLGFCGLFAATLLASHYRERVALMDRLLVAAVGGAGVFVALVTVAAGTIGAPIGREGIVLMILAAYTVTGLRTRQALLCGSAIVAAHVGASAAWELWAGLTESIVFGVSANLVGFLGTSTHERAARENFLRTEILNHIAAEDSLTGLANRRAFDEHLGHVLTLAARSHQRVAIAMVDVDHFKRFNDTLGHPAGDAGLMALARALQRLARRPLDLAARVGGEEFVLVWFDVAPGAAEHMGKQVGAAVEALGIEFEASPTGRLTVSSGIADVAPAPGTTARETLTVADEALYEAKAAGRNQFRIREIAPRSLD